MYQLNMTTKSWPIAGCFKIAHGSVDKIDVVTVTIRDGGLMGRGECRPYTRYNETPKSVTAQIESIRPRIETEITPEQLQHLLPAGAARNALDCALWDLRAKQLAHPIWKVLGIPKPRPRTTAFTLSIDTPAKMAAAAQRAKQYPILKLKIDGIVGLDACLAVLQARPDAELIIDANEALSSHELRTFRNRLAHAPILLIEQPLKAGEFENIDNTPNTLPILCADESLHTHKDLPALWQAGYRAVNVKLDKCGGLSEALHLMQTARAMGFIVMAGCMVGTSLAMAPMMVLESYADFIDLDGPLLLAEDVQNGLRYQDDIIHPPRPILWG